VRCMGEEEFGLSTRMVWFKEEVVDSAFYDGGIRLRNVFSGECVKVLGTGRADLWDIAVDRKGRLVSCGSAVVSVWGN